MKRNGVYKVFVICLLCFLFCTVFFACGKETPTNATTSTTANTTTETGLTFEPSDNFVIEVDLAAIDYPETASVIHAKRIIFDYEAGKEALGFLLPEQILIDERFDSVAKVIIAKDNTYQSSLNVSYDPWQEGMSHDMRQPTGFAYFVRRLVDGGSPLHTMCTDPHHWQASRWRTISPYVTSEELSDLSLADAQLTLTDIMRDLGVSAADLPEIDLDYTRAILSENQFSVAYSETLSVSPEDFGWTAEKLALQPDAYTVRFRQKIAGIPLNWMEWNSRIAQQTVEAVRQQVHGSVATDGTLSLTMGNLVSPHTYGETRNIVSPMVVVEQLNDMIAASLSDGVYYLSDIELCYAIFETDVRDELVLYPYWVVPLEYEGYLVGSGVVRTNLDRDIYAFNAFTGELVNSVSLPVE